MSRETRTFRARALAQAHPLSPGANRYVNEVIAREKKSQPQPEIGMWAGYALTNGYCLRRVEEAEMLKEAPQPTTDDVQALEQRATDLAGRIRTSGAERHHLISETDIVADLDDLIAGEIERRLDDWREAVSAETWHQLEEYIAWWTIKGYALRIAETTEAGA